MLNSGNTDARRDGVALGSKYGAGSGQIWLDKVNCEGNETSIASCQHRPWATHSCDHSEDVSIACNGTSIGKPSHTINRSFISNVTATQRVVFRK